LVKMWVVVDTVNFKVVTPPVQTAQYQEGVWTTSDLVNRKIRYILHKYIEIYHMNRLVPPTVSYISQEINNLMKETLLNHYTASLTNMYLSI